jgi:predicted RNA binding protein YcfA (HicA-like mRNA interferase family)
MPYSFREIEKRLRKQGYKVVRQRGSHVLFSDGKTTFPVPHHKGKSISPGVERKIIRAIGLTKKEFKNLV